MKVYIAAPYVRRQAAQWLRGTLETAGVEVTSRWLSELNNNDHAGAQMDLDDVDAADAIILYNPPNFHREGGGRHVEFGYAIAQGKRLILVGTPSVIFHYLDSVEVVPDLQALIALVTAGSAVLAPLSQ